MRNYNNETRKKISATLDKLGSISKDEKKVLLVFIITAFLWVTRTYLKEYNIFSVCYSPVYINIFF